VPVGATISQRAKWIKSQVGRAGGGDLSAVARRANESRNPCRAMRWMTLSLQSTLRYEDWVTGRTPRPSGIIPAKLLCRPCGCHGKSGSFQGLNTGTRAFSKS
jgi:hypothetical protein